MRSPMVFPVASTLDLPAKLAVAAPLGEHNVCYRLSDARVALHGVIAGDDKVGVYALLDGIIERALRAGVEVSCLAPAGAPSAAVERLTWLWTTPGELDAATGLARDMVMRRDRSFGPALVILDYAVLTLAGDRLEAWEEIAVLGAAVNVSVLAVAESLSDSLLLNRLARGNLFHFRSLADTDAAAGERRLPGARLDELPAPGEQSYGWARDLRGTPIPFAIAPDHALSGAAAH